MQFNKVLGPLALSIALALPTLEAQAQNTPGTAISQNTVAADIITLFSLAAQVYPEFADGSGWHLFEGYTYKFFPGTGVYAGVKDGYVYLLGGPYGDSLIPYFTLSSAIASLQEALQGGGGGGAAVDFGNIASVKTTADLPRLFEQLTLDWYTAGFATRLKMERIGVESVAGTSTEHLKVTISGFNAPQPIVSELWVDASGKTLRYISNGFEYPPAQAQVLGPSVTSAMLLALAGADSPSIRTSIDAAVKNPDVQAQTKKVSFGSGAYDTLAITIGNAQSLHYQTEVTDFGNFSMVTRFEGKVGATMTSGYALIDMTLR